MQKKKIKALRKNSRLFEIVAVSVLGIWSLTVLFTLFLAISNSLKGIVDFTLDPLGFPSKLRWDNYEKAFDQLYIKISEETGARNVYLVELFYNSLVYVLGVSIVTNYTHFTCAYVAAKHPNIVTKSMHATVIFLLAFPVVGSVASNYMMLRMTGVYNNRFMYFLYCGGFLGTDFLIFYAASKGLDKAYIEAAKLDGAGYYRIQFQIVMPMLKTIIFGMMLMDIISNWNTWMTPMLYLPSYPTVSYALYKFQFNTENSVSQLPAQMAGCVLVMMPTLILFIAFRNKFIGNITLGGLKG